MLERVNYILADARCQLALQEYYEQRLEHRWIFENIELYQLISIRQDGLPPIANAYY